MTAHDELEDQFAQWRQYVERRRALRPSDADELEDHLRHEFDALVRAGQAMQRVATQAFALSLSARLVFGCFADLRTRRCGLIRTLDGGQTWTVPAAERFITVLNGAPGLRHLEVQVNGRLYRLDFPKEEIAVIREDVLERR